MQRQASPSTGSTTVTTALPSNSTSPPQEEEVGTLRLRGRHVIAESELGAEGRGVKWVEGTIDNEGMGRKSSKICCIYHKPRPFDESSSDESSTDEDVPASRKGGQGDAGPSKGAKKYGAHKHGKECGGGGEGKHEVNALDGGGRKKRS